MTTKNELIEICKEFVESEGESIDKLFEAIMDYPLEDIPTISVGRRLRQLEEEAALSQ